MDATWMVDPVAPRAATDWVASPHDDAVAEATHGPGAPALTIDGLDTLAHVVADALDCGDDHTAWTITQAVERIARLADDDPRPPSPVIGRRFARAHSRLLELARRDMCLAADDAHDTLPARTRSQESRMYNLNRPLEQALERERRARAQRDHHAHARRVRDGMLWSQRLGAALVAVGQRLARSAVDHSTTPSPPATRQACSPPPSG